jgi:hypothetical protein
MKETYSAPRETNVLTVSFFAPAQRRFLEYTQDRTLQFRGVPSGVVAPFLACDLGDNKSGSEARQPGDGLWRAAAQGRVHVWDVATKAEIQQFQTHPRNYEHGLIFHRHQIIARAFGGPDDDLAPDTGRSPRWLGQSRHSLKFLPDGQRL